MYLSFTKKRSRLGNGQHLLLAVSVTIYKMFAVEMILTLTYPLKSARVKCKYASRKLIHYLQFHDNSLNCTSRVLSLHLDWNSRTFKDLLSNLLRTFKDHDFATDNVAIFAILLLQ